MFKYDRVIIGIDQSYNNTGISIAADRKLVKVRSLQLDSYKTNSDKRRALANTLDGLLINMEFQKRNGLQSDGY
jgi:hypothetical protein